MATDPVRHQNGVLLPQHKDVKRDKSQIRTIRFNLRVTCFSFFLACLSFSSILNLQSSLNMKAGIGVISMSILFGMFILSSLFLGPLVVSKLPSKVTILIGWGTYLVFFLANMLPEWWTMLPAATLLGLWNGPLWIAAGVYITELATRYSDLTGEGLLTTLSRYNGIFFMSTFAANICGSVLSSVVLFHSEELFGKWFDDDLDLNKTLSHVDGMASQLYGRLANESFYYDGEVYLTALRNLTLVAPEFVALDNDTQDVKMVQSLCGANYCPFAMEAEEAASMPNKTLVRILMGILVTCQVFSTITIIFLRRIEHATSDETTKKEKDPDDAEIGVSCSTFIGSLSILKDCKMLLLVFPFLSAGMFYSTTSADFTQAHISCTLGVGMVGHIMSTHALGYVVTSYATGCLVKYIQRFWHLTAAIGVQVAVIATWLLWGPNPSQLWVFFVLSSMCGMVDATWRVHMQALIGLLFHKNKGAAFAYFYTFFALGSTIVFAYSKFLCFNVKAYILTIVLGLSAISYAILEVRLHRQNVLDFGDSQEELKEEDSLFIPQDIQGGLKPPLGNALMPPRSVTLKRRRNNMEYLEGDTFCHSMPNLLNSDLSTSQWSLHESYLKRKSPTSGANQIYRVPHKSSDYLP